jgi:alkaline phosphatase
LASARHANGTQFKLLAMDRRKFFRNGSLAAFGATLLNPLDLTANEIEFEGLSKGKTAKNIIFLVSDGMSSGTLNMADVLMNRKFGKTTNWMQLYKDNRVVRALMDTASASSIVTDSAAGSAAWGGGVRVPNGALNIGANGEKYLPILQKFKLAGKKVGCVTTVPITHATPAGFCVNQQSRGDQSDIAEQYLDLGFDIMMGGGNKYFAADKRQDKKDMYAAFAAKGWDIAKTRDEMTAANGKQILGIFGEDALPYSIDRENDAELKKNTPTLAEMAQKAIDHMKSHPKGFVMQIEGGKVDWGAHSNDVAALLYDQIAFDEAIKVAIDFAEKDKETLVIITTDHGNANPGIIYGKKADDNFDTIQRYTQTNEWILNAIRPDASTAQIREIIAAANRTTITDDEAKIIIGYYRDINKKDDAGLYNYKKLPFEAFAEMQKKTNAIGWISMDHSGDYVECCAFGPGSELLKPFIKNTDLHYLMLAAAAVENKF